jgi:hypothetical protein
MTITSAKDHAANELAKRTAHAAMELLKDPIRAFELAYANATVESCGDRCEYSLDEYTQQTCTLLRNKAKAQLQLAMDAFTSGEPVGFSLTDVKETISELYAKRRTLRVAMHAQCALRTSNCAR